MLIIQAMNVHQGGGLSLLLPLLESATEKGPAIALLDQRLKGTRTWPQHLQVRWVAPTIIDRLKAEASLRRIATSGDIVLCFGNLPPLRHLDCRVVVFLQNRLLIDSTALGMFSWKTRLRLYLERHWLAHTTANASSVIVQTPSMQRLACETLKLPASKVAICAFAATIPNRAVASVDRSLIALADHEYEFVYPASGDAYKNHRVLVAAWALLAAQGIRATLHLTVDRALYPELTKWIESECAQNQLAIVNHGHLPADKLDSLYKKASALIYPSLLESFGLPLLEARAAGLPVIASELDFVRDVVAPAQTFDPTSAVSLARAILRFIQQPTGMVDLVPATRFLEMVLSEGDADR